MTTRTAEEIRAELREALYACLPRLREIVDAPETSTADRIYAIAALGFLAFGGEGGWSGLTELFEEKETPNAG